MRKIVRIAPKVISSTKFCRSYFKPSIFKFDKDVIEDEEKEEKVKEIKPEELIHETEQIKGQKEVKSFQTETKQLLDIVATALYTDKEVFIRELVSNASDACEKLRDYGLTTEYEDPEKPLEINISVDEKLKTFTIQDTGIGMTKEELITNLGTIAHSGSKNFVKQLQEQGKQGDAISNIIGKFGVGFYSIFMVATKVRVYTRSSQKGSTGYCWESYGTGDYTIHEADGVSRGTKIILYLKDEEKEFSVKEPVERIIKKYSNFVSYDIKLNNTKVNTQRAIWLQPKNTVTQEEYKEFYKYISHANTEPYYTIHFKTEVPMSIHALFYVPDVHTEKMGMGKMESGVNVYCRKVLIQAKHRDILPEWLRFVKGAVDSEDLPLHISREHIQNSPLIRRINGILTRRVLRFFEEMMKSDMPKYITFYDEFSKFFKEGIASDLLYKDEITKLLIFDTSAGEDRITLNDYFNRMPKEQNEIYYLVSPNRQFALQSPYYEQFKKNNIEVLFLYNPIDEFVMTSIGNYNKKPIKSIERTELPESKEKKEGLTEDQMKELESWYTTILKGRVSSVKSTNRLSGTPAIIKDPENPTLRMMRKMHGEAKDEIGPQKLEVDPTNSIIIKLFNLKQDNEEKAKIVAEQIFYNAMISAGLVDDARVMLNTLSRIVEKSLE